MGKFWSLSSWPGQEHSGGKGRNLPLLALCTHWLSLSGQVEPLSPSLAACSVQRGAGRTSTADSCLVSLSAAGVCSGSHMGKVPERGDLARVPTLPGSPASDASSSLGYGGWLGPALELIVKSADVNYALREYLHYRTWPQPHGGAVLNLEHC